MDPDPAPAKPPPVKPPPVKPAPVKPAPVTTTTDPGHVGTERPPRRPPPDLEDTRAHVTPDIPTPWAAYIVLAIVLTCALIAGLAGWTR